MENELLATCLLAGRIMIEGGSEMYRVDDTMTRIAQNAGAHSARVFTTPTGLFVGIDGPAAVQIAPVAQRGIDMEKVAGVNNLSRQFAAGDLTLTQLHQALEKLDAHTPFFPVWLQILAAGLCSTTLMVIFAQAYDWFDMPLAALVGAAGFAVYYKVSRLTKLQFISELLGAFAVALFAWVGVRLGVGRSLNNIIIGAVMPLVPGVAITNSIRDMLAGHLLSGMARGMEAILSACAIGAGVAIIFRFF